MTTSPRRAILPPSSSRPESVAPAAGGEDARGDGDHPAVTHRPPAVSVGRAPERPARGGCRRPGRDPRELRHRTHGHPTSRSGHGGDARDGCDRRSHAADHRCPPAGDGKTRMRGFWRPPSTRMTGVDLTLSARGRPARTAVVARPPLDRRRARNPQPADDHQDVAAWASPRRRHARHRSPPRSPTSTKRSCRLNRIVSEVLDFARPIKFELAPVDLNALCADAAKAASPDAARPRPSGARSRAAAGRDGCRAASAGARQHPHQRAACALPRCRPRTADPDSPDHASGCRSPGRHRGAGPWRRHQSGRSGAHFRPFFTTRGTGTGLGLAITRNIIEGLGGTIAVSSAPGRGTDVRIELPAAAAPA